MAAALFEAFFYVGQRADAFLCHGMVEIKSFHK